jgi:hypothetical protein
VYTLRIDPNKTDMNAYTLKCRHSKVYGKKYFGGTLISVRASQTEPNILARKTQVSIRLISGLVVSSLEKN